MPSTYTGHKRSRKVKKRRERDTRRIIRSLMGEQEFSARRAMLAIQEADLLNKCVVDIGQYLKEEARLKEWVVCVKSTQTPRYRLIKGGIEPIEALEDTARKSQAMPKFSKSTVEQRLEQIAVPKEEISTADFSKSSENITKFLEAFCTVLATESALPVDVVHDIMRRVCGNLDISTVRTGRTLHCLAKSNRRRPALLKKCGADASGQIMMTLSAVGRNVAKGTWALRDTGYGVRVLNFATGTFLNGMTESKKQSVEGKDQEPFNPPKLSLVDESDDAPAPFEDAPAPFEDVDAPDSVPQSPPPAKPAPVAPQAPRRPLPAPAFVSTSHSDFYTARAAQRLWDVLVTECHPADYDKVIHALIEKLTGTKETPVKLVSS